MKEQFLHYVWLYKKFDLTQLFTTTGQEIIINHSGYYTQLEGPDFFNAQIIVDHQKWAGNIEIHLKSSDWYLHHHEMDDNYNNVILHVVWEHDIDVFRKDNSVIPVLELKRYVSNEVVNQYQNLIKPKTWINCENEIRFVDEFTRENWLERMFFERLEKKATEVEQLLQKNIFDWEATFFQLLAKNFGLNTNSEAFLAMSNNVPYAIIKKERNEIENVEALFFGTAGLLDNQFEDKYFLELKRRWEYLKHKYQLNINFIQPVQFFKHRPDNFPTIRLAQLAQLVVNQTNFFQLVIQPKSVQEIYTLFNGATSFYWENHYVFDKPHPKKVKKITKSFVDLLIINCILPIQFAYAQANGSLNIEKFVNLARKISPEKNAIIEKFNFYGLTINDGYKSQALLQLKKEYCNSNNCLSCAIGQKILNFTSK